MLSSVEDLASFQNQPSTSSGPLLPEDVPQQLPINDYTTIFTDGRTPVNISARHLKNHPLHEPTGTSAVLTFYPTMEEFKDFKKYIETVERNGAHLTAGIAKIVAPEGWTPRPSKKNFCDVDQYEITSPAQETIIAVENKPGTFFKRNEVHQKKMSAKVFRQLARSPEYSNPNPNLKGINIEKHYFDNILRGEPIYGADTEGSFYDENVDEFNMSRLGTVLDRAANSVIKGVNTVYLYFGMYKTTFPWHAEDMDLYSINFLHFGEPKYWFAISSEHADRFERFMSQQFSTYAERSGKKTCRAFLRHKSYIVTPELLRAAKIPFATMMQRPNEFIITFPRGYHMGFNLGYNLAESTNFATERWIDYGKDAILCHCNKDSVRIDMKPFMEEHRKNEFLHWDAYWYGARQELKESVKGRKKPIRCHDQAAKKRRLEISNGSCTESCSSGSEEEPSYFMSNLPGYTFSSCQFKPDYDALLAMFKKETKLLRADAVDFYQERIYNKTKGIEWPHCAVCQYFQPVHMAAKISDIPNSSRRLVPSSCFAKSPDRENGKEEHGTDKLLTCSNCYITVHSTCCSGDYPNRESGWKCLRCRNHTEVEIRTTSCQLCQLRGGPMIPCQIGRDSTWVHVICALFNRRAVFDRSIGPTSCFVEPYQRQYSETPSMPQILDAYRSELGELYENLRWQCLVCKKVEGGLIPCAHCIEECSATMPSLAHVTCARRVGFLCELRDYPLETAIICPKHGQSYLTNKSSETWKFKGDTPYYVEDNQSSSGFSSGLITNVEMKPTIVADFLDNSCSRDILPEEVQSCECLHCDNGDHQYGSRIKIVWDDCKVYDAYFRGKGFTKEYTIKLEDSRTLKCARSKIKTVREYKSLSKTTLQCKIPVSPT